MINEEGRPLEGTAHVLGAEDNLRLAVGPDAEEPLSLPLAANVKHPGPSVPLGEAHPADNEQVWTGIFDVHASTSGLVSIVTPRDWSGKRFSNRDLAAEYALELAMGGLDVYMGVCTVRPDLPPGGRGRSADMFEMPGLWADIDYGAVGHAQPGRGLTLLPDRGAALAFMGEGPPPTLVVHSGGGFQAWWLFSQPQRLIASTRADLAAASKQWQTALIDRARAQGFHLDDTADLPRVLRVPGTGNHKVPPARPVVIEGRGGPRYELSDLRCLSTAPALSASSRAKALPARIKVAPLRTLAHSASASAQVTPVPLRTTSSSALARIRKALEAHGCSPTDAGAARCPAHDDDHPSLSLHPGKDFAGVLLKCHAGCRTPKVLEALGLTTADLFDDPPEQRQGYVVAEEYEYTDELGEVLFVKERRYPKDFRCKRWLDGKWTYKLGDVRRVLYRLPDVVAAVEAGKTVYVVEGEKDVERLYELGVVATCNFEGAAKGRDSAKWKSAYGDVLAGAHVVVIADCDEAGLAHARAIVADLTGKAASIDVRRAMDGKDVSDHLDAGHSLEQLQEADLGTVAEVDAWSAADEWKQLQPVPFVAARVLPAFPVDALPEPIALMVEAVAEFTQTDPGMAGTTSLGMLAAAVGGRVQIEARPGWIEPLNLYAAIVAKPGERKSAVLSFMSAPLQAAEQTLTELSVADRVEAITTKDVAEKAAEVAKLAAGKANDDERHQLLADAIVAAGAADVIVVPGVPRLLADDVTPEKLAGLLAEQGGRLAVVSAEGGIFDTIAGRYTSRIPNLDVWLKGHSGDSLRVDRLGRAPEFIPTPALTLCLMLQPTVLDQIANNGQFRGRGLLARFLFAIPASKLGWRITGAAPVPGLVSDGYHELIAGLAIELAGWAKPAVLHMTGDAAALVADIERQLEPQFRPAGELEHLAEWGAKMVGAILRIAGLLHMGQHPEDGCERPVDVDTVQRATRLGDYFRAHALVAFDRMSTNPEANDADYLVSVLRRLGADTITRRDLHAAASRSRFGKVNDLDAPLKLLEDHGYLLPQPAPSTPGRGRPRSPIWWVHPSLTSTEATEITVGPSTDSSVA